MTEQPDLSSVREYQLMEKLARQGDLAFYKAMEALMLFRQLSPEKQRLFLEELRAHVARREAEGAGKLPGPAR